MVWQEVFDLYGKKAIITGGASGLSLGAAEALHEAGVEVVIIDISKKVEQEAARLSENGPATFGVQADLSNREQLKQAFNVAVGKLNSLDILVNGVGIQRRNKCEDFTLQDWDDVIEVNLTSVFQMCQLAGRLMHEFAGDVVSLGSGVTEFRIGDRVVAEPHKGCGKCINCIRGLYTTCLNYGNLAKGHRHYGFTVNGGYAEYVAIHINCLHRIPETISYAEGTIATAAGTALYGMERAGWTQPGDVVAIIGPGPIGLMAAQLAKVFGASQIILVGTRSSRLEVGKKVGADILINIKEEDLNERIKEITNGIGVDFTIEASGSQSGAAQAVGITKKSGRISLIGMYKEDVKIDLNRVVQYNITVAGSKAEGMWCLERIIPLMADGRIDVKPLITHRFPLEDINEAVKNV